MTPRTPLFAAVALAVGLLAGACGGGNDSPATAPAEAASDAADKAQAIEVEANDFAFSPSTVSGPAGQEVTITVRNTGKAPHTFTWAAGGIDVEVPAGESRDVILTMPSSGSMEFVCKYHTAQGMKGTLAPS